LPQTLPHSSAHFPHELHYPRFTAALKVLELARADAEALVAAVRPTAADAARIGGRVRCLDALSGNVSATLELVELILQRTHCVSGVQAAMAAGDLDAGAGHIATFLALERKLGAAAAAGAAGDAGQAEDQRQAR
jgi:conserved oligomeric Golgi complex subunit 4